MPQRFLHFISHAGLETHLVNAGAMQFQKQFAVGDAGAQAFSEWLAAQAGALHTVLIDVADEGFYVDTIPYTIGSDRRALIQRRMTQQFFGSPYATSVSLGRERSGRRDERVLLTAITRPALIEPWLNAMQAHGALLRALYTVPLLTGELVRKLAPGVPRGLILLLSSAGIRQIHFEDGRLRFSRLAPAPEGPFARWGLDCLREAQKTWQYLSAQRWIPRGSSLPVTIVADAQDGKALLADIARSAQADNKLNFTTASIESLTRQLGLGNSAAGSDSQALVMQLALRERGQGAQLASANERRFYRLWQIRFAALGGCALALIAALALGAHWALDAREQRTEAALLRDEARATDQRYTTLLGTLPKIPASVESLRAAVDGVEALRAGITDPRDALLQLSKVMGNFPDITLDQLEWQAAGEKEKEKAAGSSLQIRASLDIASASNPRATLMRIQAFATALGLQSGARVSTLQQPFDTGSDKLLRSDAENAEKRPEFRLQLDWTGARQ